MGMVQNSLVVNRAEVVAMHEVEWLKVLDKLVRSSINMDFPERVIDDKRENSQEDKLFLSKVDTSMKYTEGHYTIGLPFRNDDSKLPNNKEYAKQRLKGIGKRMRRDSKLSSDYKAFMATMIEKKYAILVPQRLLDGNDGRVWYIPHHGVYHPKKPNKIRVVFNCSAKWQGVSLNELLLHGPDLTNNLLGILLRFRQEPVALMVNTQPDVYQMAIHLFGAVSSPSCANAALHKNAIDNQVLFDPEIAETVLWTTV
uniref:Uncharacterized protein LOC102805443 n=1 Tax=Saccoglossus kowalevskii TaxID=10224 RepID=A0ABM0LUL4_SACKO|nr:PREDICTED: uncharacterized protein LOC102805443 [Saccoglossus kowalevskii]